MQKARAVSAALGAAAAWTVITLITVLMSIVTVATGILSAPFDRQRRLAHWSATLWGQLIFWSIPVWRIRVQGRRRLPKGAAVLVSNHQSMLDIMALLCLWHQFKWVAKASLFAIPFAGWSMWAAKYIKLYRGEQGSIRETYAAAKRYLRDGMAVFIFPEGTRSTTGQMLPFKNGAFKLALEAGVPIVPIAVVGTGELLQRGSWLLRARGRVRIKVLEPVDGRRYAPEQFAELRDHVRSRIERALSTMRKAGSRRPIRPRRAAK